MKRYDVILADPPWNYGKMKPRKKSYRGGNPLSHYNVMTDKEIMELCIPSNPNSCLFLWVTNPKIKLGLDVVEKWGFKYQTTLTWVKTFKNKSPITNGMGFYFRGATEHILFGTKGNFSIHPSIRKSNVFFAERAGHSRKPEASYELIESVTVGNRLEMFARKHRDGWDSWGNEVENSIELNMDY